MSQYENQRRQNPGGNHEQILHNILPKYWEVFHTHNISRRESGDLLSREGDNNLLPCYDVGIFLVGYSSLPIALSLAEIQPSQEIYFLYSSGTDGTKDTCFDIADRMRAMLLELDDFEDLIDRVDSSVCRLEEFGLKVDNPSDPVETFKLIKEVIDKVGGKRIALDLTGGKKTMIGGGFTAGSILDFADFIADSACDMFYIDSLKYDRHRGAPTPGTEFLTRLDNPYNVYNVQSVQQAKKLFEKHNYEAAAVLWEEVEKKLKGYAARYGLDEEHDTVKKHLYMADCYRFWEAFDYFEAQASKNDQGYLWNYCDKHAHQSGIDVLHILSQVTSLSTLFRKESRVIHYAVDRYQNGIRRQDSDRYEDAIVRFTQVIEILCKYQLYQIVNNDNLLVRDRTERNLAWQRVSTINQLNRWPAWNLTPLIKFLFGNDDSNTYESYPYSYQISNSGQLLCSRTFGYTSVGDIICLITPRNNFIHVENAPTSEETEDLRELANTFLENFSCKYRNDTDLSFHELLELHKFRRLE